MRSRASFRGHPIHPALIPFPIAFLVGALAADVAGWLGDFADGAVLGWYLATAGLVMGLIAAIPGIIDAVYTVPPASSGKKRVVRHAAAALGGLILFGIVWVLRGGPGVQPEPVLLVLEAAGAALLAMAGWMGGVLAFRNQIGVDHRYADAGKWKELRLPATTGPVTVAREDELKADQMKLLVIGEERIVLARTSDEWCAFSDRCTHRGGSLAGGVMARGIVVCPWHGSHFDACTGQVTAGPATENIRTWPVTVERGEVRVDIR